MFCYSKSAKAEGSLTVTAPDGWNSTKVGLSDPVVMEKTGR